MVKWRLWEKIAFEILNYELVAGIIDLKFLIVDKNQSVHLKEMNILQVPMLNLSPDHSYESLMNLCLLNSEFGDTCTTP